MKYVSCRVFVTQCTFLSPAGGLTGASRARHRIPSRFTGQMGSRRCVWCCRSGCVWGLLPNVPTPTASCCTGTKPREAEAVGIDAHWQDAHCHRLNSACGKRPCCSPTRYLKPQILTLKPCTPLSHACSSPRFDVWVRDATCRLIIHHYTAAQAVS